MTECGYHIFYAQEAVFMDMETLAEKIKAIIGDMPVYLTFDIDALDPSAAPGTGTPVIGGPSAAQVRKLLYLLKGDVYKRQFVRYILFLSFFFFPEPFSPKVKNINMKLIWP